MQVTVGRALVPSFSRVDTPEEVAHYRAAILAAYGTSGHGRQRGFPGCNPRSLSRADLKAITPQSHVVGLKSDGVRYALFLTLRPGGGAVALMIDRVFGMYEVEVVAPAEYFERTTLLEGELVWQQPNEDQMIYLVFDALVVKGTRLVGEPFATRLLAATRCTEHSATLAAHEDVESAACEADTLVLVHFNPALTMRPKVFVASEHAPRLWAQRADMDHRVDGVIVHDNRAPYRVGTAKVGAVLKWKLHATVDLQCDKDGWVCTPEGALPRTLYGRHVVLAESKVGRDATTPLLEYLVRIDAETIRLFAVRHRTDKDTANRMETVRATVRDVIESVSIDELGQCGAAVS